MPFRDPFTKRLEEDRKLRRHAGQIISSLLPLSDEEVRALFSDVRALIGLMEGGIVDRPICDEAAALYARIPGTASEKQRTVHLLELWLQYIETGAIDIGKTMEMARITGYDNLHQAQHLRIDDRDPPSATEVIVAPQPKLRLVKC